MPPDAVAAPSPSRSVPLDALREPFYVGSVQRLYAIPGDEAHMVTETTSGGSVFDVGTIFEIPGSDVARAVFRHVFYTRLGEPDTWQEVAEAIGAETGLPAAYREELSAGTLPRLCQSGARTHHGGMLDATTGAVSTGGLPAAPSPFNIVRRYTIRKPEPLRLFGRRLFDYSGYEGRDRYVVPLECIVRFGVTSASSIYKRYLKLAPAERTAFEAELGAGGPLEPWRYLAAPVLDFTSKYEPEDRAVTRQEAFNMSGLGGAEFAELSRLALLGGYALKVLVESFGLRLWDLKWEFAKDGDDLVFVDTIDSDSFRATATLEDGGDRIAVHYNKQAMRDYYRIAHAGWLAAVDAAKAEAAAQGVPFVEILRAEQAAGRAPGDPQVEAEFVSIQEAKMAAIRDGITGAADGGAVRAALERAGREEIAFYTARGFREALVAINGIPAPSN